MTEKGRNDEGRMTNDEGNVDFFQRGNVATGKGEKSRKRLLKGSIFLKSKKMYYLCAF